MGSRDKKQSFFSRSLDIISAPLSQPKTTFTKGLLAGARAVKKSRGKISKGDRREAAKVIGTTLLSTAIAGGTVLGGGTVAGRIAVKKGAFAIAKKAASKPLVSLAAAGLVTTKGGRDLIRRIPETAFRGGQVAGKVLGGEDPGLSIKEGFATAGLLGAGAIAGKIAYDRATGNQIRLPGIKDLGFTDAKPVGLGGIPLKTVSPGIKPMVSTSGSTPISSAQSPAGQTTIVQISI